MNEKQKKIDQKGYFCTNHDLVEKIHTKKGIFCENNENLGVSRGNKEKASCFGAFLSSPLSLYFETKNYDDDDDHGSNPELGRRKIAEIPPPQRYPMYVPKHLIISAYLSKPLGFVRKISNVCTKDHIISANLPKPLGFVTIGALSNLV